MARRELESNVLHAPEMASVTVLPNPVARSASVRLVVGQRAKVRVAILDVAGREIVEVASGVLDGGTHDLIWSGKDTRGQRVVAGVYFASVEVVGVRAMRKFVWLATSQ